MLQFSKCYCIELSFSFLFICYILNKLPLCTSAVGQKKLSSNHFFSSSLPSNFNSFFFMLLHLMCKFLLLLVAVVQSEWKWKGEREASSKDDTNNCNCPIIVLCNLMKGEHCFLLNYCIRVCVCVACISFPERAKLVFGSTFFISICLSMPASTHPSIYLYCNHFIVSPTAYQRTHARTHCSIPSG